MSYFTIIVLALFLAWLIQGLRKEVNNLKAENEDIKEFTNFDYKVLAQHRELSRELRNTSMAHLDDDVAKSHKES